MFWAVREVTFGVATGEAFGIIGANGSGKSTLLKLLTGILRPTSGRIVQRGRIAPLLELGAGFHPELSGRENVYLNAALLGFSRADTNRRFADIVEFAELERFIDTPLKHYSSGMQVRLGFAIAIHCEPDILVADEVMAVGDEVFQRACIERIYGLKREGRTIILVSHSLDQIRDLCDRAAWLEGGRLRALGDSLSVVDAYLEASNLRTQARLEREKAMVSPDAPSPPVLGFHPPLVGAGAAVVTRRWGSGEVRLTGLELLTESGESTSVTTTGLPLIVRMHYQATEPVARPVFGIGIHHGEHVHLAGPNTHDFHFQIDRLIGSGYVDCRIESLPLLRGTYSLSVAVYDEDRVHAYDHHDRLYTFHVHQGLAHQEYGIIQLPVSWRHRADGASVNGVTSLDATTAAAESLAGGLPR